MPLILHRKSKIRRFTHLHFVTELLFVQQLINERAGRECEYDAGRGEVGGEPLAGVEVRDALAHRLRDAPGLDEPAGDHGHPDDADTDDRQLPGRDR